MRRIQPVKHLRSLVATKQRAAVLTLVLFFGLVAATMPSLHAANSETRQYMAMPELQLYSVSDDFTDGPVQYALTYPFLGKEAFDTEVKRIVDERKADFMHIASTPHLFARLQLHYTVHFYNDTFLSLSITSQQSAGDTAQTHEYTLLYNRETEKLLQLEDLFTTDKYRKIITPPLKKQLKKSLGDDYNEWQVKEAISNASQFIVDKKQRLIFLFQPGAVAPEDRGIVSATLPGTAIRDITKRDISQQLLDIPPAPKPKPKPQEPTTTSTPAPAVNLTPSPVPQADPSGVDCGVAACIALTFDDGPGGPTGELLDILDANNAPATFFVLGQQAERNPGMIQRIQNSGHVIGNHTYDHPNLEQLSFTDAAGQISRTSDIIQNITGVRPGIARAPYGAMNGDLAVSLGIPFIGWSLDPQDWLYRDVAHVCNSVVNGAHAGGIILAHDIHQTSVDGMRCAIPQLIERGFVLVTVPQLLGFNTSTSPGIYSAR